MAKICLISLGCAKNLIDSEQMLSLIDEAGFELTDDPEEADAAVINTCAFIESAKSEAIENIIRMGEYKQTGRLKRLVVTGCLAQRYKEELLNEMPEIDALVGTGSCHDIIAALTAKEKRTEFFDDINAPLDETGRVISTGPGWAYIKIAEGCSNSCAYCVIPSLRGKYRSRPMENIISEAKALAETGVKELIVVAQDPTLYGVDLYHRRRLSELTRELCKIEGIEWIRLHYLYPDAVDDELIETIASEPKVLKYLDIPIQHINNGILKTMRRRGTGDDIRALFKRLRLRIPGVVLRTSIITGLPGETEAEFEELCDFLKEAKIERAGVFPFSPEEGTPAYDMDYPDTETANRRAELINEIQADIMEQFNESRIGTVTRVLCEGFYEETGLFAGRSFSESPDVDGVIWFSGENVEPGEFYDVILRGELEGELCGEMV
ncbi:MAG: 30S ribosomal protein S12 methylthiotransferase RimO [Oscillospiraceae bacterium]